MSQFSSEDFQVHLPSYLTKERQDGIVKELKDFPEISSYYLSKYFYSNGILQGDIVQNIELFKPKDANKIITTGIVLSNSCDISEENERYKEVYITFCPIVSLDKFKSIVEQEGKKFNEIEEDIKKQKITDIFYLRKEHSFLPEDHIALLSHAVSIPYSIFPKENKRFSLSQIGFYLFIFKLSVHYCRFHENVQRY